MKTISAGLEAHIASEVTTLATCWRLVPKVGTAKGFTSHDKDLTIDALLYKASTGFSPTAVAATSDLAVDNLDVEGVISDSDISEADVMAGKYDFAEIEIFLVNYDNLAQGKLYIRKGWIGEIKLQGGRFVAEVRGLTQKLSQNIGELYSPSCRAQLGDSRCKVNMAPHTKTGSVTGATSRQVFTDSSRTEAAGYFNQGKITFTSGDNDDLSMEIKDFAASGQITLALPMPFAVDVGDTYTIYAGCDKTFGTCIAKFSNALNFRGEPHVPGIDKIFETAGTRSG